MRRVREAQTLIARALEPDIVAVVQGGDREAAHDLDIVVVDPGVEINRDGEDQDLDHMEDHEDRVRGIGGVVAAAEVRAEIGGRDRDQDHLEDHALLPENEAEAETAEESDRALAHSEEDHLLALLEKKEAASLIVRIKNEITNTVNRAKKRKKVKQTKRTGYLWRANASSA